MDYYAGLDVSLEDTAICMVDRTGRIVTEARAASEPQTLIAALKGIDLPLERIGLEACSLTAWLHDELRRAGLPAICIETRQANAAMKTMPNKTDRNDARALAQIMRTGWYRQVHVKSRPCRLWRSLLVARRTVLNGMRSIENVVRAVLREGGHKLGTPSRAAFAGRVRDLMAEDASVKSLVEPLLAILATMLDQFARLTKQVFNIVRREKVCRRLMSVPAGVVTNSLARRSTKQHILCWCAAGSGLRAWGMKIAKHRTMARARVAVARKLAVILHRMWRDETEFRFGKQPATA